MARLETLLRLLSRTAVVVLLGDHGRHVAAAAGLESEGNRSHRDGMPVDCVLFKVSYGGVP